MADTSSKLTKVRGEYSDLSGIWIYNRDAYDNLGGFVDGAHLQQYIREDSNAYGRRQKRCWFPNFAKDVVVTLSGHLFKKPAVRDFGTNAVLNAFKESTNQKGDITLQEFMKQVDTHSYVFGYCMVLVDKPATVSATKQEEIKTGKPYARIIDPLDMLDWEIDEIGNFDWVKVRESIRTNADDPLAEHEVEYQYRIWTKNNWTLYSNDEKVIAAGEHKLGRVPIVMVKHDESLKYPDIGTSTFTSITQVAIRMFNAISERDNILVGATFPILTIPSLDIGGQAAATDDTSTEKNAPALGTDSIIGFDPESKHAPAFINHDGKTTDAYTTLIDSLIKQIQQLARLEFTGGTYASGVAMAFDFEKTNQALKAKAERLKDSEVAILKLVDMWMGGTGDTTKITVEYPEDFNIMDTDKELKHIFDKLSLNISEQFDKEVRMAAARKLLPALPDKTMKIIDTEIDAGVKDVDAFDDEDDE